MSRFYLPPLSLALRRGMAVAACAAVLLTSFEDEALSAIAAMSAGDATELASRSSRTSEASLFPDLSRPQSANGESSASDVGTTVAPPTKPPCPRSLLSSVETRTVAFGEPRPLRSLLCVWLL